MDDLDLAALLTPTPTDDPLRFTLDVPDGLQQGRGAWGGIATGAMVSAAGILEPRPGMAVRHLSAQLVAPLMVGRADIVVEVLRRGSATTTVAIRVQDRDGALVAHGVVVLGAARRGEGMPGGPAWLTVEPPEELAAGPQAVPPVVSGHPMAPSFTRHFELRPIGGLPFSGQAGGEVRGWLRPRMPLSRVNAAVVTALADAWWVAVMAQLDRPRPAATVGFTLDLPSDPSDLPRVPDGGLAALFHRGRTLAAHDGFTIETRELWTIEGRLVSWNTQTVAVIA